MQGFGRHLAASVAIIAVFVVCAVALGATGPATVRDSVEGKAAVADVAVPLKVAEPDAAVTEPAPQATAVGDAEVIRPAEKAALAPVAASPSQPEAAPVIVPQDAVPQPVNPQPAAPQEAEPALNPPKDLAGAFIPADPAYVQLNWDPNNTKRVIDYFNVYRLVVGAPDPEKVPPIATTKKPAYQDSDIEPGTTYRYWVTAVAKGGEESGASNTVEIKTYDNQPPAAPQGVQAWAIDPGVSFDWLPNGEGNLAGYNVYEPIGGSGKWRRVNSQPILDNHYYYKGGLAGKTYAVSAVNFYGVESEYAKVQALVSAPVIYEENDAAISVEGLWVTEGYVGPANGKIRVAGDPGAKLNFRFNGSQVKMFVAKYWTCGAANIYIDGVLVKTLNLYSYDTIFGVVDLNVPGLKRGEHMLTMVALGSGNPEGTYNFVNVDAFEVR
jgi:hypothetical protein